MYLYITIKSIVMAIALVAGFSLYPDDSRLPDLHPRFQAFTPAGGDTQRVFKVPEAAQNHDINRYRGRRGGKFRLGKGVRTELETGAGSSCLYRVRPVRGAMPGGHDRKTPVTQTCDPGHQARSF